VYERFYKLYLTNKKDVEKKAVRSFAGFFGYMIGMNPINNTKRKVFHNNKEINFKFNDIAHFEFLCYVCGTLVKTNDEIIQRIPGTLYTHKECSN